MQVTWILVVVLVFAYCFPVVTNAANLGLSPNTGVYQTGTAFTVRVTVNSQGKSINAAEGTIRFNKNELQVVSVDRSNSIFSLWVAEPAFSNSAGTITFSGGVPAGYIGAAGTVLNVTFRTVTSGTARVTLQDGSVLANDGRGSNVLVGMSGGTFTIQALSTTPAPERVIEYVAPANTPAAPVISSPTHSSPDEWYSKNSAELEWVLPSGVTAVRTLLDTNPTSIPTRVYESPIDSISLTDLPEGESYFHLQFRNSEGWGRIAHYRLAIDTKPPQDLTLTLPSDFNPSNPIQTLTISVTDATPVKTLLVRINDDEPFTLELKSGTSSFELPSLTPGYHIISVEAKDAAGNSAFASQSFTLVAFERPIFTEYPSLISEDNVPVITGLTRPFATVSVIIRRDGVEPRVYEVQASEDGTFVFIPDGTLLTGVYEVSAQATDVNGAQSEVSQVVRILVQQPGYLRIGSWLVSFLSVIIPLLVLVMALAIGVWYSIVYLRRFRQKVTVESREALEILHREFSLLEKILAEEAIDMAKDRKSGELTKAERETVTTMAKALTLARTRVEKEITDITELTERYDK